MLRLWLTIAGCTALVGCASAGFLQPNPTSPPTPCGRQDIEASLSSCAPVILQHVGQARSGRLDRPLPLDHDASGRLADDVLSLDRAAPPGPTPFYAAARSDNERQYLFYGLYYPVDWSGPAETPHYDHAGDFEGALIVVARATGQVEAVVTQAHRLFYLWRAESESADRSASGQLLLTTSGRPVLFAESGGHGLYAFGSGAWRPRGGRALPLGPAGVRKELLAEISTTRCGKWAESWIPAELRRLDELQRFTHGPTGKFRDLPRGAQPPWLWSDRRGGALGRQGRLITDPAGFYQTVRAQRRP